MKINPEFSCVLVALTLLTGCFDPVPSTDDGGEGSTSSTSDEQSSDDGPDSPTTSSDESMDPDSSDSGSDDGLDDDTGDSGDSGEMEDVTPPEVLGVVPPDGTMGVSAETTIVVTFSEPMDPISTQAAWQSADLGDVVQEWNDDFTELTVTPNDPLEYATGSDPAAINAQQYAFAVTSVATDEAGNPLAQDFSASFFTLREVVLPVPYVDEMTGMTGPTVNGVNDSDVWVGDTQSDNIQWGTLTFDLPSLPEDVEGLTSAVISVDQTYVGGAPYGALPGLGEVEVHDVEYETHFDANDVPLLGDVGVLSTNATLETKVLDVTEAVRDDVEAGNPTTQFRLRFPVGTNSNDVLDRVTFSKETLDLQLGFLVP